MLKIYKILMLLICGGIISISATQSTEATNTTAHNSNAPTSVAPVMTASVGAVATTQQYQTNVNTESQQHTSANSFIDLFWYADWVVKTVMLLLIFGSIWSWAIIFDRFISFGLLKRKMRHILELYATEESLEVIFKMVHKKSQDNPLSYVFVMLFKESFTSSNGGLRARHNLTQRLENVISIAINRAVSKLEGGIPFLATLASSAPFIGLFGTVWGIMVSFQSIAASKNTTLAVVAPGIAEALLATAFGLVAAIPAVVFYNKFSSELNRIEDETTMFATEIMNAILRNDRGGD